MQPREWWGSRLFLTTLNLGADCARSRAILQRTTRDFHGEDCSAAHVGSGISACDRKRFVPEGLGGIPSTSVSLSPRQTLTESAICSRRYKALDPRCSNSSEDCGSCDASSTTTRKTLESLTSSIYDELAPFRSAHEDLIKNRIARKRRASSIIWKGPKDSKASKNRDPLESGLGKIALHAFSFGWDDGKVSVSGFQRLRLLPREFRAQLQASLHVFLRPAEADAVAEFFDPEGNGYVDGESFMRWFLQAKNRYREERMARRAAGQDEEQRQQRERQRAHKEAREEVNRAAIAVEFSKIDEEKAVAILSRVALSYHSQRSGRDAAQREFACALAPDDFRNQLRLSFGIRLTRRQFAALFHLIDADGNGFVDGAEFLHFFFSLCNEERTREQRRLELNRKVRATKLGLRNPPSLWSELGR